MKTGDLVRPKRRTGHHMVGVVVEVDPTRMGAVGYRVYFHKDHINSEHKWVRTLWFERQQLELINGSR